MDLYRNLKYRHEVRYSVRVRGRVVDWVTCATLRGVRFKHATSSQQARARQSRLVCQWVKSDDVDLGICSPAGCAVRIIADPKTADGFRWSDTGERCEYATVAWLTEDGLLLGVR